MPGAKTTRRGNGAGWGGPAKGAGHRITGPEDAKRITALRTPERAMEKAERAAKLLAHLEGLAFGAESEAVQVQAATAALNRLEGLPVQKVDATVTRATITAEPMTEDDWTSAYSLAPASGTTESPH